jgi:hypothetical protein
MTTQNNTELMRTYLTLLSESSPSSLTKNSELDEAIGIKSLTGSWIGSWFSHHQKGKLILQKSGIQYKNLFKKYMGTKSIGNQKIDYSTVTWRILVTFLKSKAATLITIENRHGIPLTVEDIKGMFNDVILKRSIVAGLKNMAKGYILPTSANLGSVYDRPISLGTNPQNNSSAGVPPSGELSQDNDNLKMIGEIITDDFLQAAITIMIDKFDEVDSSDNPFQTPSAVQSTKTSSAPPQTDKQQSSSQPTTSTQTQNQPTPAISKDQLEQLTKALGSKS